MYSKNWWGMARGDKVEDENGEEKIENLLLVQGSDGRKALLMNTDNRDDGNRAARLLLRGPKRRVSLSE